MPARIDHPAIREQVKTLYFANGRNLTAAAKQANIPIDRAEKWKERGKWDLITSNLDVSETVGTIANNVANDLAEHEKETRLSLARSARRMAKDAEECTLRDSDKVLKVGQLAGIVHKWNDGKQGESFSLNVLNMGALEVRVGKEAQDSDPTISG